MFIDEKPRAPAVQRRPNQKMLGFDRLPKCPPVAVDSERRVNVVSPAATGNREDGELVRLARGGNQAAFDSLVRKYQRMVVKLVGRYTRNLADAEDAAQEAFIRAYKGISHFRFECAFSTWLYRVAVNTVKNNIKARRRDPFANTAEWPAWMDQQPLQMSDYETPEALIVVDDIRDAVNAAILELPEDLRNAIILREIDGWTYQAIADAQQVPLGTVRSRVSRARDVIDQHLRRVSNGGLERPSPKPIKDFGVEPLPRKRRSSERSCK